MISHIVLYKVNPKNPKAVEMILENTKTRLGFFSRNGFCKLHAAPIPPSQRAVGGNNFQVLLNFMFRDRKSFDEYMTHPQHMGFVRFVLRGWMLKGSTAEDPEKEFIHHILHAGPDSPPVERERNPAIPEEEVVWAGEQVYDASAE